MTLEQEMRVEVIRLEKELQMIDSELDKFQGKINVLLDARRKKEYELRILRGSFDEDYVKRREEESLAKLLKDVRKIKA